MPPRLAAGQLRQRLAAGAALRTARQGGGVSVRAMASTLGRARAADITDLERGQRPIDAETIAGYERVLRCDLSSITPENRAERELEGRFEVVHYELTAHVDPDGQIRRQRHRLRLRVLGAPVNLFNLMEEFRDENTLPRFYEMYGGRFGRTMDPDSELIDYVVKTPVDLQPGDEHEILYDYVDEQGPEELVIYPVHGQPVRLFDLRLWIPPEAVSRTRVWQATGVPAMAKAADALEQQPVPISRNGLAQARFRRPRPPHGYGLRLSSAAKPSPDGSLDELLALEQPEQGRQLRELRLHHQFDRAAVRRYVGLRSPSMLSKIEGGRQLASPAIVAAYLSLAGLQVTASDGEAPSGNVSIRPISVHWDIGLSEHGIGPVMQEMTFECLVDGVDCVQLATVDETDTTDVIVAYENLEGGVLELEEHEEGRVVLACRFVPLVRGELHAVRHLVLLEQPDRLLRSSLGERKASVSGWYRSEADEPPSFTVSSVSRVAPSYVVSERLPRRCLSPLRLTEARYVHGEFNDLELGTTYGVWLGGRSNEP